MQPQIITIPAKKLIGMHVTISSANNTTPAMWGQFMPRRNEVDNAISMDLISMQVFDASIPLENFTPDTLFENWAAVEVADFDNVPEGMETYTIQGGKYAVYMHKGDYKTYFETRKYIMGTWLPQEGYLLDDREYFEVLGENYKGNDPESEEEVWIPIK
jgi:AraC family transcriptional regulator